MGISSYLAIVSALIVSVALPIGLMIFFRRKGGKWAAFLVGAAVFLLFGLILEPVFHNLISLTPLWAGLQGSVWLYGLYGGLTAGVFEETGRFLAFRLFLKKERRPVAALSYGAGHGGAEAILLMGMTMVNNLILAVMVSSGRTADPAVLEAGAQLASVPAAMFLWAALERVSAIILHLSNSVLVFAAVKSPGKGWLFPAAILAHAAVNFLAAVCNAYLPVAVTEGLILLAAALLAFFAQRIYRTLQPADPEN